METLHNSSVEKAGEAMLQHIKGIQAYSASEHHVEGINSNSCRAVNLHHGEVPTIAGQPFQRQTRMHNNGCHAPLSTQNQDILESRKGNLGTLSRHRRHIPKCVPSYLVHNLRKRKVPSKIVHFVHNML